MSIEPTRAVLAKLSLEQHVGNAKIVVETHTGEDENSYAVYVMGLTHPVRFHLTDETLNVLVDLLNKAQKYKMKGCL